MDKYYESMIRDIKKDYDIEDDSPLAELIITFQYLLEEYEKQEKVINGIQKEIDKIFKEYGPINRALLLNMFKKIYRLLLTLEDAEETDINVGEV